jgi:hypothetical protein
LDFPKELADDEKTLENVQEWDFFIHKTKNDLKERIVKEGERTADSYQEKRLDSFNNYLLVIAEGYVAWHSAIEGADDIPLSHHAYGAVSLYCYYKSLQCGHPLFTYLCEDQDSILANFKKKFLTTAAGRPLFSDRQLDKLANILPDDPFEDADTRPEPRELNPPVNQVPTMGQPSQPGTRQQPGHLDRAHAEETNVRLPRSLETVLWKVKEVLHDLVPPLFIELCRAVDTSQAIVKANAQMVATLKKKKTLDMAKILEADLASQATVAPENMKDMVNSLVDLRMLHQNNRSKKAVLKAVRKKSSGGDSTAKSSPGKLNSGGKQNERSRKVTFSNTPSTPPSAKRPKRHHTTNPESDYTKYKQRQQLPPNPYSQRNPRSPSPSGLGTGRGRGRGRGRNQGRGGSNSGRGRGRGRS